MTLFVVAASFEDRCLAMMRDLHDTGPQDQVVVLDFAGYENVGPYLLNRAALNALASQGQPSVSIVPCATSTPISAKEGLRAEILRCRPDRLVVDISTLPRSFLFCFCSLAVELGLDTEIVYYRPREYGEDLSRGVRTVQSIPGFEGDPAAGADIVLLLLLGFEGYKAAQVWERLGPTEVVALWGDPPYDDRFLEVSKEKNEQFLRLPSRVIEGACHTYNVATALRQLGKAYSDIRSRMPDSSVVACPLGTKMQSLALFAFACTHPDLSVVYVSSSKYFTGSYSTGWVPTPVRIRLLDLVQARPDVD